MRPETGSTVCATLQPSLSATRTPRSADRFLAVADAVLVVGWPCGHARGPLPSLWHIVLFFIGAFAMRGAGCT
jgi:4-hydroxybenzoate polyprenyltransferase